MYKYCAKCGAEVEQTSAFCFACGAHISKENPALDESPIILQPQPVPEPETPPETVAAPDEPPEQPKKRKLRKPLLIAILAAAVIVMAIIAWQVLDAGYETALNTYAAVCNGDLDKIQQMAPAEYWEKLAGEESSVIEVLQAERRVQERRNANNAQYYGKDARFTVKCVHSEPIGEVSLEKLRTFFEEEYGISSSKVKEAVYLDVYARWDGSGSKISQLEKYCAVKIGTQWYIGRYYEIKEDGHFNFHTPTVGFVDVIGRSALKEASLRQSS